MPAICLDCEREHGPRYTGPCEHGRPAEPAELLAELAELRDFARRVRAILVDADEHWIGELSGADVIEELSSALDAHGFGATAGDRS